MFKRLVVALAGALLLSWTCAATGDDGIRFQDVTAATGLARYLEGDPQHLPWRYAHGAGWGDVDGDGRPDLYLGAFAARSWYDRPESPVPNWLFFNRPDGFVPAERANLQFAERNARCAGVLFADLDNDGDLDLIVANHVQRPTHTGSRLFENLGEGTYRDVTPQGGVWPSRIGMRNVTAVDLDRDGLLDLAMADGSYGKDAEAAAHLIVLKNLGQFQFSEISDELGLPQGHTLGLGLAVGDVNQDGAPDLFVAGSNRLFVSDATGKFQEAHPGRFSAPPADLREGLHCGATFGDLNGDDLLDLVTTEHGVPARIHVYVNRGVRDDVPDLVEVSAAAGVGALFPRGTRDLPIKTAHVALEDVDNDGRADIVLSVIYRDAQGGIQPVVLRNLSTKGGELQFTPPPFDDLVGYYAPAPLADYDGDGRVDMFMASWFEALPNHLFRNVTNSGNWISVRVEGNGRGLNTMGIGATVRVYHAGRLRDRDKLLGRRDIAVGTGYASTQEAVAHVGLGDAKSCDLEITWNGHRKRLKDVAANQAVTVAIDDERDRERR